MNKHAKPRAHAPRPNILSLSLREFFRRKKLKPNAIARAFLERHRVTTTKALLEVSLIQESDGVLEAIRPLRTALSKCGLTPHRHKFLMSYI